MSSFFFLEHGGFKLIPDISISGKGEVGSVLFFADREPKELKGEVLSITNDSATSVNLLKVLFAETYGFIPHCKTSATPTVDQHCRGALVIGDRLLDSDRTWSKALVRIDLGQWWFERFGLPMVFGVWAAQKLWINQKPERFKTICTQLRKLFDYGLTQQFGEVLEEAERRTGLTKPRLEHYYRSELNFDLTDSHWQGLALYAKLCARHGLLAKERSQLTFE